MDWSRFNEGIPEVRAMLAEKARRTIKDQIPWARHKQYEAYQWEEAPKPEPPSAYMPKPEVLPLRPVLPAKSIVDDEMIRKSGVERLRIKKEMMKRRYERIRSALSIKQSFLNPYHTVD